MPSYLCECRGPCRRVIVIGHETYKVLRAQGAVLTPECAEREERNVVFEYAGAVAALTVGHGRAVVATGGTVGRPTRSL